MAETHSSSQSVNTRPAARLSAEEIAEAAEHEVAQMMSSSPGPPSGPEDDDDVDELELDVEAPATFSATSSLAIPLMSAANLQNQLVVARQKARQLKLHPYQRDATEEFVKGSSDIRQIMIFTQLCAVENLVTGIKTAAPPFVSSSELLDNIRSFVVAVLLSSKLNAYRNSVPVDHVMAILTGVPRSYVPDNLSGNSYTLKVVKKDIQEELTQTRSRIKKLIKDSIRESPSESDSIFDLVTKLVTNTRCTVTVPLCARIALLHKVYVESSDATYWDKVDACLLLFRTMAGGLAWKVNRAFELTLQADRAAYGDNTLYSLPNSTGDIFQNSVDDVVAGTH